MYLYAEDGVHRPLPHQTSGCSRAVVGLAPQPTVLVRLALNNLSQDWQVFVQSILDRDKLPKWDKMWADLQQHEMRQDLVKSTISGSSEMKQVKEEETVALASKGQQEQRRRKKDLSMVKCFRGGKLGHYNTQSPLIKKDKEEKQDQQAAFAEIDRLSSRLEEDFATIEDIPLGVRWGDLVLQPQRATRWVGFLRRSTS